MKKQNKKLKQIKTIAFTILYMFIGLSIFKFLPQLIFGNEIKSDASMHIVIAIFCIYLISFFITKKSWRIPYFIFSLIVIIIISVQRILVNAHNELGLLLGLLIGFSSIVLADQQSYKRIIDF